MRLLFVQVEVNGSINIAKAKKILNGRLVSPGDICRNGRVIKRTRAIFIKIKKKLKE